MKRSEINRAIGWAEALLHEHHISLPDYAGWSPSEWKARREDTGAVRQLMLGWDITDYGCGDFGKIGTVLYTVRNGSHAAPDVGVPYCEKYLIMKDGQRLPKHYHVFKTEDIINRAGGVLQVFLWNADPKTGEQLDTPVVVYRDGIPYTCAPGEEILVTPGNSVTLTPYLAHIFGPKSGTGDVVCGEVSRVNDDLTDNFFLERTARFPTIEEDAPALRPMCNEYDRL